MPLAHARTPAAALRPARRSVSEQGAAPWPVPGAGSGPAAPAWGGRSTGRTVARRSRGRGRSRGRRSGGGQEPGAAPGARSAPAGRAWLEETASGLLQGLCGSSHFHSVPPRKQREPLPVACTASFLLALETIALLH